MAMTMNPLVIYHGGCNDGFGAAWAVKQARPEAELYAAKYGDPPPHFERRPVYIVDFSYPREVLLEMAKRAHRLVVIDHHVSAREDLAGIARPTASSDGTCPIETVFDMDQSGAVLAWRYFHEEPVPVLLRHIQDRDLWRYMIRSTREVCAALNSYPHDLDVWTDLVKEYDSDLADCGYRGTRLYYEGAAICRIHDKNVKSLIRGGMRRVEFEGYYDVPMLCAPYMFASDACHEMLQQTDSRIAIVYWDVQDGRKFSLRANGQADVAKIAEKFGGGGHKNAAGFFVPSDHPLSVL